MKEHWPHGLEKHWCVGPALIRPPAHAPQVCLPGPTTVIATLPPPLPTLSPPPSHRSAAGIVIGVIVGGAGGVAGVVGGVLYCCFRDAFRNLLRKCFKDDCVLMVLPHSAGELTVAIEEHASAGAPITGTACASTAFRPGLRRTRPLHQAQAQAGVMRRAQPGRPYLCRRPAPVPDRSSGCGSRSRRRRAANSSSDCKAPAQTAGAACRKAPAPSPVLPCGVTNQHRPDVPIRFPGRLSLRCHLHGVAGA